MEIIDKLKTNLRKVMEGFADFKEEAQEQTVKIKSAWNDPDNRLFHRVGRVLHHFSGYREAAQQHLYKFWFYTFWLKWGAVAWVVWWAIQDGHPV
tara:strand:+ start:1114 stop:1398 length:285 start_codon:yes stop_codon:yes gene_type:complete